MLRTEKEVRLAPSNHEGSPRRDFPTQNDLFADVRSAVESKFQQMEQTHDRIRAQELASRLAGDTVR
jgi:hypothetical protein